MSLIRRELIFAATVEECGHPFECWIESFSDGTYEVHFHAECDQCERMAREICRAIYGNTPITKTE